MLWRYSGVRPLYDDGRTNASAITRDYVLKLDMTEGAPGFAGAPILNVFGGKLTTYRKLAEHALEKLAPHFPAMGAPWTHASPLPGGGFEGGFKALEAELNRAYPWLPSAHLQGIAKRHGTLALDWLNGAKQLADLGEHFGAGLYAAEVEHMIATEWACRAAHHGTPGAVHNTHFTDGILMRRSKCGLFMDQRQQARLRDYLDQP